MKKFESNIPIAQAINFVALEFLMIAELEVVGFENKRTMY